MQPLRIGLIGNRDDEVVAHHAIPKAIGLAAAACGVDVDVAWIATDRIGSAHDLALLDGFWCVPGSPYRSMQGALEAIRHARETRAPFLGTCGGFQHAVIEYARNVLGWADAEHAETSPDASRAVIVPLACALVEVRAPVHLLQGTRIAAAYGTDTIEEAYRCRYGLGDGFIAAAEQVPAGSDRLCVDAVDEAGDVRGIELPGHPFYVATLFQHERVALLDVCPPLVRAFVEAMAARRALRVAA